MSQSSPRVFWIMIDSLGVGELPDAPTFGDTGSNTLASIVNTTGGLDCPNLQKLGLANILNLKLWPGSASPQGSYGKMAELSPGKDTTTGHWEMAGVPLDFAFPVFPTGFPKELIDAFCSKAAVPGVLGNKAASGTEIIKELGAEHMNTGKPIVYTSADSVFQIAAHENSFGLQRLYDICTIARKLCDPYNIGRIIARPFVGKTPADFKRTPNRHDYSVLPPKPTVLAAAASAKHRVAGIGKIPDIFAHIGVTEEIPSRSNAEGMEKLTQTAAEKNWTGISMVNLVDFDSLYGHRRDPKGYRQALEEMDTQLPAFLQKLGPNDLVLMSADHGCDPTFRGSDHTREYVPIVMLQPGTPGKNLGIRKTFADVAVTISKHLKLSYKCPGTSLL